MIPAARYIAPTTTTRPKGAHLLEGFSPKLGRRLTLYRRAAFDVWLMLEADPYATLFCERPIAVPVDGSSLTIDFWVRSAAQERFVIAREPGTQRSIEIDGIPIALCYVTAAEREANRIKIRNLERVLPTVVMCRDLVPASLLRAIEQLVRAPMTLGDIERHFHPGEPSPVRAGVFQLLLAGRLRCLQFATHLISSLSLIEPASAPHDSSPPH